MKLKKLAFDLTVCKLADTAAVNLELPLYFIGRTDEELLKSTGVRG